MAFVSRAERRLEISNKSPTNVGPGAYIGPKYYKQTQSCAPFTSTTERDIHKLFGTKFTPGPGSYAITPASAPNPKSPSGFESTSIHRALAPFATGSERFKNKNSEASPGPGSYNLPANWNDKKGQKQKTEWTAVNWMRMPSAPSIPSHNQIFGYEEKPNGELVMQKNPEKVFAGSQVDSVGPGHYEIKTLETANLTKGTKWGKSTSKKGLEVKSTTAANIGPGSYSEAQLNISPMYKFKPSAVFMSGMKKPKESLNGKTEEDEDSGEEGIPGPGYYYNENTGTSFGQKTQPRHLQFFGGKSERFKHSKKEFNVGPGQYDSDPNLKNEGESKAPFASTKIRFTYKPDEIPGPGQYTEANLTEDLKKKVWGRHGVFGCTEKRFAIHRIEEESPGPGHYPPDAHKRIGIHNSATRKPTSVFVSKSKREIKSDSAPPPGSYEVKSTIGAQKTPAIPRVPLASQSSATDKKKVGFNAQCDRFREGVPPETVAIGPGSYNSNQQKAQSSSNVILPKSKRFSSEKPKEQTPGPGAYQEENEAWIKKSYNVIFSDIN